VPLTTSALGPRALTHRSPNSSVLAVRFSFYVFVVCACAFLVLRAIMTDERGFVTLRSYGDFMQRFGPPRGCLARVRSILSAADSQL
jgi:hypothetical protein